MGTNEGRLPVCACFFRLVPQIRQDALDGAAGDDGVARVAFAHDRLVNGADRGAAADVERRAGEDGHDFRLHECVSFFD